ncbi:hypothetical protein K1719_030748 [Acacia pycnantha]|nr:hypothetical protein K1719_030748 [Acacia pycnantha]
MLRTKIALDAQELDEGIILLKSSTHQFPDPRLSCLLASAVRAGAEKTGEKECVGFSNTSNLGKRILIPLHPHTREKM